MSIEIESDVEESQFGKGFAYCLGLFLAHAERFSKERFCEKCKSSPSIFPSLFFYGAADHLYYFQWDKAPWGIRERCLVFKDKCLKLKYSLWEDVSWSDVDDAVNEAKKILLEYDKICGFDAIKACWE